MRHHLIICREVADSVAARSKVAQITFVGCLNGGGQVKATENEDSKSLLKRVTELYNSVESKSMENSQYVHRLYSDWLGGDNSNSLLTTSYHAVEKEANALTIKW